MDIPNKKTCFLKRCFSIRGDGINLFGDDECCLDTGILFDDFDGCDAGLCSSKDSKLHPGSINNQFDWTNNHQWKSTPPNIKYLPMWASRWPDGVRCNFPGPPQFMPLNAQYVLFIARWMIMNVRWFEKHFGGDCDCDDGDGDDDHDDDDDDDDDDDGKEVVWYVLMFASNRSFYNQLTFSFCFCNSCIWNWPCDDEWFFFTENDSWRTGAAE